MELSSVQSNPFDQDDTIENPFADPSIREAATISCTVSIQEYDPFDKSKEKESPCQTDQKTTDACQGRKYFNLKSLNSLIPKAMESPKTYCSHNQPNIQALMKQQEELERKAAELARREREILQDHRCPLMGASRRNNWPPFSENCYFQPCFYQDIEVDIPVEFQKVVKDLYHLWMFHGGLMLFNVLGGILLSDFGITSCAIVYTMLFVPLSYICWFRPAYKAFRSDSSFNFMIFFMVFFMQFVVSTVQAIGINTGTIGVIAAIRAFNAGIIRGIFCVIIALGFICAATADLVLLTKVHNIYRSSGATFDKAKQEFATEFLNSRQVKDAAGQVITSTLNSANR